MLMVLHPSLSDVASSTPLTLALLIMLSMPGIAHQRVEMETRVRQHRLILSLVKLWLNSTASLFAVLLIFYLCIRIWGQIVSPLLELDSHRSDRLEQLVLIDMLGEYVGHIVFSTHFLYCNFLVHNLLL